jgi:hypothetical protein
MIQFQCSSCGKHLQVDDWLAGATGRCPGCGRAVSTPAATTPIPPPVSVAAEELAPPKKQLQQRLGFAVEWVKHHPYAASVAVAFFCLGISVLAQLRGGVWWSVVLRLPITVLLMVGITYAVIRFYYGIFYFLGGALSAGWHAAKPPEPQARPHRGEDVPDREEQI